MEASDLEAASAVLAKPRSHTFTVPSLVILTFPGFRSRWMIPFSRAASRVSAICLATGRAYSIGTGPHAIRSASVDPSTSSMNDGVVLEVVDGSDVRMIEGRENLSLTLETSHVVGIVRERSGEDFDRYVASEFRVPGAVDFAHAACPDKRKNLVRPQDGFRPREAW